MKYFILILICLIINNLAFTQSKQDLEKRKKKNYQNIKITNELLEKTKKKKNVSYNQILLLKSKIKSRESIISSIKEEVNLLNNKIFVHQEVILNLQKDLESLKAEYAQLIYYSFLNNDTYNNLMFILAADDFNMGYRRLKYYQQYSKHRKKQAQKIQETSEKINNELVTLEIIKADKKDLLLNEKHEKNVLNTEKNQQNQNLKKLNLKEGELKITLKKQQEIAQNLQKEIEKIIEEEARLAAARSNNKTPEFFKLTPAEKIISENISKNKRALPWPTSRGVVISPFGPSPHEKYKNVVIDNNGIDIATFEGAPVRAVFEGVVSRVFVLSGMHKTVIVRHGNFLTVYSNLKEVIVKKGDKISTKQTIGIVYTDHKNDNKSVLKFQIWKEDQKMNPEEWLAKG